MEKKDIKAAALRVIAQGMKDAVPAGNCPMHGSYGCSDNCAGMSANHHTMIKFTAKETNDLLTLIEHVRTDLSYNEGGTFNDGYDGLDMKAVKAAERAIERIKTLVVNGA